MTLSVNSNSLALRSSRALLDSSTRLQTSMERLSTGLRINKSADDASGLVISEFQRAQIVGLQQGIENIERATNLLQTAESALGEVNGLLLQARGLAVEASNNGALDDDALAAAQSELDNLINTINRVALTTKFGTKTLIDGSFAVSSATSTDSHHHASEAAAVDLIPEGESRVIIDDHHTDPGHAGSPNTHFFAETGEEHHYAWQDQDPST